MLTNFRWQKFSNHPFLEKYSYCANAFSRINFESPLIICICLLHPINKMFVFKTRQLVLSRSCCSTGSLYHTRLDHVALSPRKCVGGLQWIHGSNFQSRAWCALVWFFGAMLFDWKVQIVLKCFSHTWKAPKFGWTGTFKLFLKQELKKRAPGSGDRDDPVIINDDGEVEEEEDDWEHLVFEYERWASLLRKLRDILVLTTLLRYSNEDKQLSPEVHEVSLTYLLSKGQGQCRGHLAVGHRRCLLAHARCVCV